MKANEAPNKIYLNPLLMEDGESIVRRCSFERQRDSQIEYARTDVLVRKACEYLRNTKRCVVECIGEMYISLCCQKEKLWNSVNQ